MLMMGEVIKVKENPEGKALYVQHSRAEQTFASVRRSSWTVNFRESQRESRGGESRKMIESVLLLE